MADYVIYDVTVSTLTPLHIGSGAAPLLQHYDFAMQGGYTWRLDENALLDAQRVDSLQLAEQLAQTPPADLLGPGDFTPESPFFRYRIRGGVRSGDRGAQLREQLKTTVYADGQAHDRPYLPGATLKGALRTAVAWYAWGQRKLTPEASQLGRRREFAAQSYEQTLFGRNPNHDFLRALQVGDSAPVESERMMVLNARVLNRGGNFASPVELEAVRPETEFRLRIKLDRQLYSEWAKARELTLGGENLLAHLVQVVQAHSQERIAREAEWFAKVAGAERIVQFYRQLADAKLGSRRCLLALGWGAGWEGKTFGTRLLADSRFMERIVGDYRLSRGRWNPQRPFPTSRRVAVAVVEEGGRKFERPVSPVGWCLVEVKERK